MAMPKCDRRVMVCPRMLAAAVLALVCCSGWLTQVSAMHDSKSFTAQHEAFGSITEFGFEKGGSIHVSGAYSSSSSQEPVTLVMCSISDLDSLLRAHGTISSLCSVNLTYACEWAAELNINHQAVSFQGFAQTEDYYDFMYLNCNADSVGLEIAYRFINPGNEHLSTGEIPFKTMSLVFAVLWGTVFVAWGVNGLLHRRIANPLFRVLGIVPFLSSVQQLAATFYWRKLSRTGNEDWFLLISMLGLAALSSTALLATLVVIAKGWHITRRRLLDTEWRNIGVMALVFIVSYATYEVFSGFFFLFLLILVYVLILRYLFASVSTNIRVLRFQLRFMQAANPGLPEESLLPGRQLRVTRVFRSSLPVYIILDIMLHVWSLMALERSPWAESMLINGCTLAVTVFVCIVFRLRRNSVYFQDAFNQPLMLSSRPEPTQVVIIKNPDTKDASGRIYANIAVGVPLARVSACTPSFNPPDPPASGAGGGVVVNVPPASQRVTDADTLHGNGAMLNVDAGALAPLLTRR